MLIELSRKTKSLITAGLFLLIFSTANAQPLNYPGKPAFTELKSSEHKVAISFPSTWALDTPIRNEVWIATGTLRERQGVCFVRLSTIQNLGLSKPESFFSQIDKSKFISLNSISMPDINVRVYDITTLSGRKARRTIYTGTDSGIKTATITYQVLNGDSLFTIGCMSQTQDFGVLINDFETIISSFRSTK